MNSHKTILIKYTLHFWKNKIFLLILVCGSVIDRLLFFLLGLLICGKLEVAVASFQFCHAGELPACVSNWKLPFSFEGSSPGSKIRPLPRNHSSHPALRRIHIAVIPRYQVDVYVINRLAGSAADVDADVETGRVEAFADDDCHRVEQVPASGLLVGGKLEIRTAVPPGNHQHVTGIYRVLVENGE